MEQGVFQAGWCSLRRSRQPEVVRLRCIQWLGRGGAAELRDATRVGRKAKKQMRLTVFVGILGLVVNSWPAAAQETIDLHRHGMHVKGYQQDPYSGIFNWAGVNCCNGQDCRKIVDPKDVQPITGGYRIRPTGETVNEQTTGVSPDNGWHICRTTDYKKTIRCLLVPPGGA
jgi:hypothetical protein